MTCLPITLGLLIALLLGGCGTRASDVSMTVYNDASEPVVLWFYKSGGDVESHLMSPGTFAAVRPSGSMDTPISELPAMELKPGELLGTGARRGRFDAANEPILAVFGSARTLGEMAATPKRALSVDRVPLGAGENYVIIESAIPTRAARVSAGAFKQAIAGGSEAEASAATP